MIIFPNDEKREGSSRGGDTGRRPGRPAGWRPDPLEGSGFTAGARDAMRPPRAGFRSPERPAASRPEPFEESELGE